VLTLAIDTATAGVVVGLVDVDVDVTVDVTVDVVDSTHVLGERRTDGPARHGESLAPAIAAVLAETGHPPAELAAVVVGTGPGPFTGLRVGMVSAAAIGDALGIPVYGVCSLDAVALGLPDSRGTTVVVTDARRREVYWATYRDGERVDGPHVSSPADLLPGPAADRVVGGGAVLYGLPGAVHAGPTAAGLVAAARHARVERRPPAPLRAAYLRRPDAVEPAARAPAGLP